MSSPLHTSRVWAEAVSSLWAGKKAGLLSPVSTSSVKRISTLSTWFWAPHLGTESQLTAENNPLIWGPRPSCMAATKPASPWKWEWVQRHVAKPAGIYLNATFPWALRGHCRKPSPPQPCLFEYNALLRRSSDVHKHCKMYFTHLM